MKDDPLSALKGNKSCKTYNFRIKVGNLQMAYCLYFVNIFIKLTFLSLLWQRCRFSANDSCNCVTLFLPLQLLIVDQWYLYTVTSNSDHISDKCVNCMECNNCLLMLICYYCLVLCSVITALCSVITALCSVITALCSVITALCCIDIMLCSCVLCSAVFRNSSETSEWISMKLSEIL